MGIIHQLQGQLLNCHRHRPLASRISRRLVRTSSAPSKTTCDTTRNDDVGRVYYLAHMNYARLKAPLDDPCMAEFKAAMDPINALAKASSGFVWSLDHPVDDDREAVPVLRDDPLCMPQLSLWTGPQELVHFAFKSGHVIYYKRKREWFTPPVVDTQPYWAVCWWFAPTADCQVPTLEQAFDRLQVLCANQQSTLEAFALSDAKDFPPPQTDN